MIQNFKSIKGYKVKILYSTPGCGFFKGPSVTLFRKVGPVSSGLSQAAHILELEYADLNLGCTT